MEEQLSENNKERTYECYLVNGYWYLSGTLPKDSNSNGGVFEIIISLKDAQVIKLIHGKEHHDSVIR
jgi:hypothetical protein